LVRIFFILLKSLALPINQCIIPDNVEQGQSQANIAPISQQAIRPGGSDDYDDHLLFQTWDYQLASYIQPFGFAFQ